ncbi:MAG: hypothetical protein HYZ74_08515 [Elusimicrobia bacterium]|nr:hypothetical protein [Elusimicrobiota bacterium]
MALIRSAALGALAYAAIAFCYPDWTGRSYHVMVLSLIAGGSVGVWFLHKLLDVSGGAAKIGVEVAFVAAIALFVGYTMPQKSGKPPFQQWAEGVKPTRDTARRGFDRIGLDPDGAVAAKVVNLFPRR